MKNFISIFLVVLIVFSCNQTPSKEQQAIAQLKQEIVKDLTENILPFWATKTIDPNGGFYGRVGFDGTPVPSADKGGILNARLIWTFSSAFRMLGDEQYKVLADRAQRYFLDYFVDKECGGTFTSVKADGTPSDSGKMIYQNAFAVYGLSEHYRATGNKESLDAAIDVYNKMVEHAYDPINGGFIERFTREWVMVEEAYPKQMNNNLHVLEALTNLYRVWPDKGLKEQLTRQIDIMSNKILNRETWHENLYLTMEFENKRNIDSYGHDIEFSWLLVEAAEVLGDEKILEDTRHVAVNLARVQLEEGFDELGGMYYEKADGKMITNISWWPQSECVVGYLNAWQISGEQKYLDTAIKSWGFIREYMIDHEYGGWYTNVRPDGTPIKSRTKVDQWTCPYHNSRMGFEVMTRFPN